MGSYMGGQSSNCEIISDASRMGKSKGKEKVKAIRGKLLIEVIDSGIGIS